MKHEVLDYGYVELVETWGSDERIVESARMSTDKGFRGWGDQCHACGGSGEEPICGALCSACGGVGHTVGDEKFLRFLWDNKHMSPFEQVGMTIEVQAPIFVFREWHRHRTQSYNEMSGRYTTLPSLYYIPSPKRIMHGKQAEKNKQGSAEGFSFEEACAIQQELGVAYHLVRGVYEKLRAAGVARELARLVLPVAQYSRMRASANLRNWLAFLTLRGAPEAQWEIQQYAFALYQIVADRFPRVYELFVEPTR